MRASARLGHTRRQVLQVAQRAGQRPICLRSSGLFCTAPPLRGGRLAPRPAWLLLERTVELLWRRWLEGRGEPTERVALVHRLDRGALAERGREAPACVLALDSLRPPAAPTHGGTPPPC